MSTDLDDRLFRWDEERRRGRNLSAEELCADRPDLIAALKREICKFERLDRLFPLDAVGGAAPEAPALAPLRADGYELLEKMDGGAMGVVHKARDLKSGRLVALKSIKHFSADALNHFKTEWRILQGIRHPNLVPLYDMVSDGAQWFFTMQLIEGRPFLEHVNAVCPAETSPVTRGSSPSADDTVTLPVRSAGSFGPMRAAFRQLADGILALHKHNVLHRDIKPSNVMASMRGEVVLLDFGLATAAVLDARGATSQGIKGTLLYMAPEQADSRPEMASDWYSFGVVLYQALTGDDPFTGTPHVMPWTRKQYEPPAPSTLKSDVPQDLSQLCTELLRADPSARPSGEEVCRRLEPTSVPAPPPAVAPVPVFLARKRELATLAAASADVRNGQTVTVLLHGSSGVGKSLLIQHFLGRLGETDKQVVVLSGRCFERESVPFKALDGLVDSLSRFWRRLPLVDAARLLPAGVGPLVRIFPVLASARAVAAEIQNLAQCRVQDSNDPHELRRRAFAALREVLVRIGRIWFLVLHLDDLQWGDVDSALLLTELLQQPDPPRLLLLACFRSEDRDVSPFLRAFAQGQVKEASGMDRRELPLGALTYEEALDLASRLLAADGTASSIPEAVARESRGNPFFVWQLVQAVRAGDTDLTLAGLIGRRVAALAHEPRRLLEVIAVAARPLDPAVALQAAGLGNEGRTTLIDLQSTDARLLRAGPTGQNGVETVETYHDRIRETVFAHLTREERKNHHLRLAIALESAGRADPEMLATHYEGAEDPERASRYAARAAERAEEALAFDRAAEWYRRALSLSAASAETTCRLQQRLGDALANAGRGAEAADAYLAAGVGAGPDQALELQRRAAEQFLRAGRIEEGIDLLRIILNRVGLSYPETRRQAVWQVLLRRIKIWWRGTRVRERAREISTQELSRIDVSWSSGQVLSLVDIVRGAALNLQFCLLALRAGEPRRAALALAHLASNESFVGGSRRTRVEVLLGEAEQIADRIRDPYTRGVVRTHRGVAALLLGDWREAFAVLKRAEEVLSTECTGTAWELGACFHSRFTAMHWLGKWKDSALELPALLRAARERGDLFTTTCLLMHSGRLQLTADEPNRALQAVAEALKLWPTPKSAGAFHLQHYHGLWVEAETALYSEQYEQALHLVQERWPALQQSSLLRVQYIRLNLLQLRARCVLAAAAHANGEGQSGACHGLLKSVEHDVRTIERERMPWSNAGARLIRAGLARVRGNTAEAIQLLEESETGFRAASMAMHAAAAQHCRGQLLGDEQGHELKQAASEATTNEDVRDLARLLHIFTPGLVDPSR